EGLPGGEIRFVASVEEVGRKVGLSGSQVSKLAGAATVAVLGSTSCPVCGGERWATNRTAYHDQVKAEIAGAPCPTCEGRPSWDARRALSDAELADMERLEARTEATEARGREAREEEERRRGAVYDMSVSNLTVDMPPVEQLGLRHAVALAALARVGLSEDLRSIRPVRSVEDRFGPTPELEMDLLVELHERGAIMVAPEADLSAFDFGANPGTGEAYVTSWRPREVEWSAKFADVPEVRDPDYHSDATHLTPEERRQRDSELGRLYIAELEEALDASGPWPPLWALMWEEDDWRGLWREISLHECLAYLRLVLGEHGLPFRAGDKTRLVLGEVLDRFSVAQVWGMIWRAGRDAAAFYMRNSSTREHAANTVVGSIQRQAERALGEGWNLRAFRRDRRLPRSVLSEVFFAKALRAGDAGFDGVLPPEGTTLDDLPRALRPAETSAP
ncbi:MAG: hypothetical protein M3R38_33255, partial [Actinomycetota bacterium]|nr:hypothetical protein [Actinomycetota bacterium]